MAATRLHVDIEKRLATLDLHIQLDVGTEILVLFGPSGAGKTQTLNMIAGLAMPDAGEVGLDGVPYFRRGRPGPKVVLAARRRRIGYVFQQYALFPHLNALDNVAYPLWRQRDARTQAWALLERMHLEHVAGHYPHELSGGQQQRVAIARALAVEPRVLLLDEPFSALDLAIRERLHQDLRTVQAEEGLVVIYITHNLEDAFAIGHRLAVVREGRVEQVGPLDTVMRTPATPAVLQILGIPNVLQARVLQSTPSEIVLDWDGLRLEAPPQPVQEGAPVIAYIRPEDIKILYPDRPLASVVRHNRAVGRITRMQHGPSFQTIVVQLTNGHEIEVTFPAYTYRPLALATGAEVQLSLRKDGLMLLPARGVTP